MAIEKCTISNNTTRYEVYVEYSVTQDVKAATSTISHALKLKQLTDEGDFNGNMNVTYTIGSKSFTYNGNFNIDDKGNAGSVFTIKTGDAVVIQHDTTTGKGSFQIACSGSCLSAGWGPGDITLTSKTISLPTIDRVAPTIKASVSQVTAKSLNITATSDKEVDYWQYTLDDGATWYEMPVGNGLSTSKAVANLLPHFTYKVKVRARRKYNQVYGTSSVTSVVTLGNSLINSVNTVTIDADKPILTMNWTVYESYTHKLVIKNGADEILTISNLTCTVGTNNKSITLTAEQRSTILDYMWNKKSITATFELSSYSGDVQIGGVSSTTATITTTESSAPIFTGFIPRDSNTTTGKLTSYTAFIKGYSNLYVTVSDPAAKNGAKISGYRVLVGENEKKFDASQTGLNYGAIDVYGDKVTVQVEVIDSRGYSKSYQTTIKVLDYEPISIDDYFIRRKNEVEPTAQLSLSGKYSPIIVKGSDVNKIESVKYYFASSKEGLSDLKELTTTYSNGSFEFSTLALSDANGVIEFDPEYAYTFLIGISDSITNDQIGVILNKGTPLVAYRSKKIGINEPNPTAALHIRGEGDLLKLNDATIFEAIYPVGSIYMSANATNPTTLFGGEWEQIKDTFLLSCGDKYTAGSTGGEESHTLTVDEMPKHTHEDGTDDTRAFTVSTGSTGTSAVVLSNALQGKRPTSETGGGKAHNNMPPYLAVYVWKRIS